jgi:dTDP-glucose pyrophosphorylase
MVNLIPMAGLGSRFEKEGYKLPKALVQVSGKPMIYQIIEGLPKADKWIFVVRKEHIDQYQIDRIIKEKISDAIIIPVEETTEGQACTCLLAESYLEPNEELIIAPCDSSFLYNKEKFSKLKERKEVDSIFFTLTQMEGLLKNPNAWGWYKISPDGESIKEVSIKIPVSENPYKDHAVTATFYFKKAKDFIEATKLMIKENYRINNEFYVDALPKFLIKNGKKAIIFDVDLYISWNRPSDLHDYEKIEFIIKNNLPKESLTGEEKKLFKLWERYFSRNFLET